MADTVDEPGTNASSAERGHLDEIDAHLAEITARVSEPMAPKWDGFLLRTGYRLDKLGIKLLRPTSEQDLEIYMGASVEDLVQGRNRWTDSWWRDALFYLFNNNIFLSCLFVHPNHPYRRWIRLMVVGLEFAMTFVLTVAGLFLPHDGTKTFWVVVVAPLLVYSWSTYQYYLATFPCGSSTWVPEAYRERVRWIGRSMLALNWVVALFCGYEGYYLLTKRIHSEAQQERWLLKFFATKTSEIVWSFPIELIVFGITRWWAGRSNEFKEVVEARV